MKPNKDKPTAEQRALVQLALLHDQHEPGECLTELQLALLVDHRLANEEQENLWHHLSQCQQCYDRWRLAAHELAGRQGQKNKKARIITIASGLLAAAASVLLLLNIYNPFIPVYTTKQAGSITDDAPRHESLSPPASRAESDQGHQEMRAAPPLLLLEMTAPDLTAHQEPTHPVKQARKKETSPPLPEKTPSRRSMKSSSPPQPHTASQGLGNGMLFSADYDVFDLQDEQEMIALNQVVPTVLKRLKKLPSDATISVKTYKRDRGFSLHRLADDQIEISEFGYNEQIFIIPLTGVKKSLKTIIRREFPRSNKVWLQQLTKSTN